MKFDLTKDEFNLLISLLQEKSTETPSFLLNNRYDRLLRHLRMQYDRNCRDSINHREFGVKADIKSIQDEILLNPTTDKERVDIINLLEEEKVKRKTKQHIDSHYMWRSADGIVPIVSMRTRHINNVINVLKKDIRENAHMDEVDACDDDIEYLKTLKSPF